jgi:hypothetical protein
MNRSNVAALLVAFPFCLFIYPALGENPDKCDAALVVATYNKFQTKHVDWRLATLVTEAEWDKISHDAGVNAVIYGVPVGASYSDFHDRATQKLDSRQESLTQDEYLNILWTGLDNNSTNAYIQCLNSEVFTQDGLHLAVKKAGQVDVTILVHWLPVRSDPKTFTPIWDWDGPGKNKLPHTVNAGTATVVIPRPSVQKQLAINFNGASDSVVIEPTQVVAPPPAPDPNAPLVVKGSPVNIDFQSKNRGQSSGCACGDLNITFPGSPYSARATEPFRFRYDASNMCRGQGFDRFRGTISWNGNQTTNMGNANSAALPGIAGTVVTTFSKAGDYNVVADIKADCLDVSCRNTCAATGNANVHIDP